MEITFKELTDIVYRMRDLEATSLYLDSVVEEGEVRCIYLDIYRDNECLDTVKIIEG